MADLEAADTRLSFDDILEAVQESRRGRWFLQEYEARLQKRDGQSILQAINRLENRMEAMGAGGQSSPDELSRVRGAIANARNDLLKLGLGKNAMTKEGRLFAEIAELARKSMPLAVDSNAGIVRTLQLVDEIDTTFANPGSADKGAQFFAADAALFERAPTTKPALIATEVVAAETPSPAAEPAASAPPKAEKKDESAPVGARLVIRKASQVAVEPDEPSREADLAETSAVVVTEPAPMLLEQPAQAESELPAMDNPRIVIIRRKAEDMPEVDLTPPEKSETAA